MGGLMQRIECVMGCRAQRMADQIDKPAFHVEGLARMGEDVVTVGCDGLVAAFGRVISHNHD